MMTSINKSSFFLKKESRKKYEVFFFFLVAADGVVATMTPILMILFACIRFYDITPQIPSSILLLPS